MKSGKDILRYMIDSMQSTLGADSFTDAQAQQLEMQMRMDYGGQEVYIPKIDREARRAAILKEFNGRNRRALCVKYDICKTQFYNLIKSGNGES